MEQATFIATVAAVLIALISVLKTAGLPSQWAPLVAVALGVASAYAAASQHALVSPDLFTTGLTGVIIGVSAAGTYSSIRTTAEAVGVTKPSGNP